MALKFKHDENLIGNAIGTGESYFQEVATKSESILKKSLETSKVSQVIELFYESDATRDELCIMLGIISRGYIETRSELLSFKKSDLLKEALKSLFSGNVDSSESSEEKEEEPTTDDEN